MHIVKDVEFDLSQTPRRDRDLRLDIVPIVGHRRGLDQFHAAYRTTARTVLPDLRMHRTRIDPSGDPPRRTVVVEKAESLRVSASETPSLGVTLALSSGGSLKQEKASGVHSPTGGSHW